MFHTISSLMCLFVAVVVAGCAIKPIGVVDSQTSLPTPSESIAVQGVSPSSYRVIFLKGKITDGKFEHTTVVPVLAGTPSRGYLVGKVQAGDVIVINGFWRPRDERKLQINFNFCGKNVLAFTVPEGKVVYLGDISIQETGDYSFVINYSSDVKAAKERINADYPALRDQLEPISAQVVPYKCAPVPVYEWRVIYNGR